MDERDDEARAVRQAGQAMQQRAAEEAGHDRRAQANEEELTAWAQARRDAAEYLTVTEREKAERLQLYAKLKARGALDVYYQFYPDERPPGQQARSRDHEGRER